MKLGILAGAFNPVTRAHVALALAARSKVDEIAGVVPRAYPHKEYSGATLEQRVRMLRASGAVDRVEIAESGLFIDIARQLRAPGVEMFFICGRDAAERVLAWNHPGSVTPEGMLREFGLLVAAREGEFTTPGDLAGGIGALRISEDARGVSSTEVRRRIAAGEPWEDLVPEAVVKIARGIYASGNARE